MASTDTCNATVREKGSLHICNLVMNHPTDDHDSGTHKWPRESRNIAGETAVEVQK